MSATIINVQAAYEGINNANKYIDEQNGSLDSINKNINSMSDVWEAADQRAYAEQFRNTRNRIIKFNNGLKESLTAMKKYVDDCVAIDSKTARALRNVSY